MLRIAGLVIRGGRREEGPREHPRIWRRLFHLLGGSSIPISGILAPECEFRIALAMLAGGAVLVDLSRFSFPPLNRLYVRWMAPLMKGEEVARLTGATYMLISAALVFWLFGKEVGVTVLFFVSLGDPVAALVGMRTPGPRFRGKSPGGTLAFAGTAAAIALVLVATGSVSHHWALWPGAAIAALTELASIPPDDNFTVPLIAGVAMWAMGV